MITCDLVFPGETSASTIKTCVATKFSVDYGALNMLWIYPSSLNLCCHLHPLPGVVRCCHGVFLQLLWGDGRKVMGRGPPLQPPHPASWCWAAERARGGLCSAVCVLSSFSKYTELNIYCSAQCTSHGYVHSGPLSITLPWYVIISGKHVASKMRGTSFHFTISTQMLSRAMKAFLYSSCTSLFIFSVFLLIYRYTFVAMLWNLFLK